MLRQFTTKELKRLESIHPNLRRVVEHASKNCYIFVVCGYRGQHDQDLAFEQGFSKVKYPNSKHNRSADPLFPNQSDAVDLCPFPIDWKDIGKFRQIYDAMLAASNELNIPIRAGADFNGDGKVGNDKFIDWPHFELVLK
jgi:peptidoglycan LD-endopeptidase CwlK